MGQSTNAIIAFGFNLGEELPEKLQSLMDGEDEPDLQEMLALDHSIIMPEYTETCDYKEYAAARDAALSQIKINLIEHCSGDYPMYFLAVRGSDELAIRGEPTALDPDYLDTMRFFPESIDAMRAFCNRHGIEWQEAKWHIFSMWN